jgi:hypothetical protein
MSHIVTTSRFLFFLAFSFSSSSSSLSSSFALHTCVTDHAFAVPYGDMFVVVGASYAVDAGGGGVGFGDDEMVIVVVVVDAVAVGSWLMMRAWIERSCS